jgi:hypothetical protein
MRIRLIPAAAGGVVLAVILGFAVLGLIGLGLFGLGDGAASHPRAATVIRAGATPRPPGPSPSPAPSPSPTPRPSPRPAALPVAPGAASLPQTSAFPGQHDAAFHNAMADLWLAVTTGRASYALPAFFPLGAYEKLKAIAYPGSDWRYRLWADFVMDVRAAHAVVGSHARLARVIVPDQYAAWINPGVCANSIGYWHVPGSRLVYYRDGAEHSIGIASLISWRGVWYVVHFGAVLRPVVTGMVDDPAWGTGTPGPPGGC